MVYNNRCVADKICAGKLEAYKVLWNELQESLMIYFKAKTEILPNAQLELWEYLREVPKDFVLYGGTAVALRYAHRQSVDFDFFSTISDPDVSATTDKLSFINKYARQGSKELLQTAKGTSQVIYNLQMLDNNNVQITFVRDAFWIGGAIRKPQITDSNSIKIASPIDLIATKIDSMIARKKVKDFIDVTQMISSGVSFKTGLSALFAIRRDKIASEISDTNAFFDNISISGEDFIAECFKKDNSCTKENLIQMGNVLKVLRTEIDRTNLAEVIKNSKTLVVRKDLSFENESVKL